MGSYLVMGLFFGAVIVLVTYSISIYLAVQFRAMLDYALATAATAFFFLVRTGIYSQLIAPDDTWTAGGNGRRVVTGVVMFLVIRFSRSFLETREHHKILDVGLKTLQILSLGQAALGIVLADPLPQTVMSGIASIALLSVAGYLFYKKEAAGGLFLAGWLMPFSVVVLEVQADLGFSAFRPREELLQISVAAQFVLFALTLNHRFRSLTLERVKTVNRLETIEKDLNIARQIQARSLPPKIAQIPGVDVRVHYQPLHAVGGDFYDVVQLGSKILGIVVADVVGHGVSAAMDASTVRIAFRSSAPAGEDPSDVMRLMNKFLVPHLNGRFATACFALIDTDEMVVRMSAAGHPPVLLFRRSLGDVRILETPAHMLGLDPNAQFETREESIRPGDRLILYTDGIYDGPKAVPQNVGSSVLLRACMELMPMQSPGFDLALLKRMRELRGDPQVDDITFISVDIGESAGRSLPAASEHGAQTS
ncbi:MAG: SpoIIE family protein phosphatase [Spirochaetia bacterium]|nr:SpoIIE family protein phosphatase [Spirochaetia bacterium]